MKNENSFARSATGIDLDRAIKRAERIAVNLVERGLTGDAHDINSLITLARATPQHPDLSRLEKIADDLATEGLFNTATELREIALASSATPQHSVTDQATPAAWFDAADGVEGTHPDYGNGIFFTHDCRKEAALAIPASTAPIQPEQADIDMVKGALDLCEPEEQQAFQRILAIVKGANRG